VVEATEEHHPIHLHVAVLARPGAKLLLPNLVRTVVARQAPVVAPTTVVASGGEVGLASPAVKQPRTYVVRQGDTFWDIANRTGVKMEDLKRANGQSASALRPGTTLALPGTR
jgi:LysM repeat protein